MNAAIASAEVQEFIYKHKNENPADIALRGSPFSAVTAAELAVQINGLKVLSQKAPEFVRQGIVYPPSKHIEQASSQQTAIYKRNLIDQNINSIADITGGLGLDLFYMSKLIAQRYYCDTNEEVCKLANYNFGVHERKLHVYHENGVEWLSGLQSPLDVVFIDPDRRSNSKKIILIENSSPNLLAHWDLILSKAKQVIVKLSPMLDISYVQKKLSNIKEIHVVSVKQDVKELLLVAQQNYSGNSPVVAACIEGNGVVSQYRTNPTSHELENKLPTTGKFLFEPYSVLLKSGLHDDFAAEHGLYKLDVNTHLYTQAQKRNLPLTKTFKVVEEVKLNGKAIRSITEEDTIDVVCKNFHLKPAQVLRKLNMKQGGNFTLYCVTARNKPHYYLCQRV